MIDENFKSENSEKIKTKTLKIVTVLKIKIANSQQ